MIRYGLAVCSAICFSILSACSNGDFIYGKALGDISQITGVSTGLEPKEDTLPRGIAATAAASGPPLIVGFNDIRVAIPLVAESGQSLTYVAPDGFVISMNKGFVTRTSGLGTDLNGVYLPADTPIFAGLNKAAKDELTIERIYEYWEKSRIKQDTVRCEFTSRPRKNGGAVIDEICSRYFEDKAFTNRYWTKADDTIECSRQWIHPKLAPLQFFSTDQQALTLDLTQNGC